MPEDADTRKFGDLNYESNMDFVDLPEIKSLQRGGYDEQIMF